MGKSGCDSRRGLDAAKTLNHKLIEMNKKRK